MVTVEHKGTTYAFNRDDNGRGSWEICRGKYCPVMFGNNSSNKNKIIPVEFGSFLANLAVEQGKGKLSDFATYPVPEKKPKIKREGNGNKRKPKGIPLFQLLAM